MKSIYLYEAQVLKQLCEADEQALKWFFDRYHRRIYQFALQFLKDKALSEEVVQDTFLSLWLHREKLRPKESIAPYLFTIARRNVIDLYRKKLVTEKSTEAVRQLEQTQNNTEDRLLQQDIEKILMGAMSQLTHQQKTAFRLSRIDGLSYEEIAEEMSISKNTVKQHLVGALKTMRAYFNKHDILYFFVLYFLL